MKYYSEKLNKVFDDVKTLKEAEDKAEQLEKERQAKENARKEELKKLAETRKIRAKEVEDAYKDIVEAQKHYYELRDKFVKDYGSFHMTYTDDDALRSIFEIFKLF